MTVATPQLLSESEAIRALGLQDRQNPKGALRWLVRMKRIPAVRIGRGILSFHPSDVQTFIEGATK